MVETPILVYISSSSILLPVLVAIVQWQRLNALEKRMAKMLVAIAIVQGLALLIANVGNMNNMPLYHTYLVLEFNLLLGIYYYGVFARKGSLWKSVAVISIFIFVVNGLWGEGFLSFPSYLRSIEALLATTLAIVYFIRKLWVRDTAPLQSDPAFWMSVGIFIYYTTNFLLFLYSKVLSTQIEVFDYIWTIHGYLNILLYSLYTLALVCRKKT